MGIEVVVEIGNGRAGVQDGTEGTIRGARGGELVVTDGRGRYAELAARGQVWSGTSAVIGTTVVAANVNPVAAAAATILSLYNPAGSNTDVELLRTIINHISGTPGVGSLVYNIQFGQNITATGNNGGTAGSLPACNRTSSRKGQAIIFTQTALTGGAGAQILLRPVGPHQFGAAIAATTPGLYAVVEEAGSIVIPPGGLLSLAVAAVGTTHVISAAFEWAEVPMT